MRVLLIGPYDPHCGEYTFLAPPLGVWRICGHLESLGFEASVFDPNCCEGSPQESLKQLVAGNRWDVIGISTTGMTLEYDLELAHIARRTSPGSVIVAGGMEATFDPELIFRLAPIDLVVLGEGEGPLTELLRRLGSGAPLTGIDGTAVPLNDGGVHRFAGRAMNSAELFEAISRTPYAQMPYRAYWKRLERAYALHELPAKAEREARLAEIRSVRLITLNYCPMACTFCSSTNFLHAAQGSIAKVARLDAEQCMEMIAKVVSAQPDVRTVIFQDDIFVFTNDRRIERLCELITLGKKVGDIPPELEFISTNRIDAMTAERLSAMRNAGFRVVGFGVESFSSSILAEFNKGHIYRHIEPALSTARKLGLRPFLDLILCSPSATLRDIATTLRGAYKWVMRGCEIGLYPYVIPFSGARMARDPALAPQTTYVRRHIAGTAESWLQPEHILPRDPSARDAMRAIVARYDLELEALTIEYAHVPSRARALLWVLCAIPVLRASGERMPDESRVRGKLQLALPRRRDLRSPPGAALEERVA